MVYPARKVDAVELPFHDMQKLQPQEYLNDTLIDFDIKCDIMHKSMLAPIMGLDAGWFRYKQEHVPDDLKRKFHFFNTFFYKKLNERSSTGEHCVAHCLCLGHCNTFCVYTHCNVSADQQKSSMTTGMVCHGQR